MMGILHLESTTVGRGTKRVGKTGGRTGDAGEEGREEVELSNS